MSKRKSSVIAIHRAIDMDEHGRYCNTVVYDADGNELRRVTHCTVVDMRVVLQRLAEDIAEAERRIDARPTRKVKKP